MCNEVVKTRHTSSSSQLCCGSRLLLKHDATPGIKLEGYVVPEVFDFLRRKEFVFRRNLEERRCETNVQGDII